MSEGKSNRLINEKSPYLLQHAHNPVDWYPWGDEAFEKAKVEDKPVFLSIGYSTCHWCHVMEKESFEDEEVAQFLNQYFISIKVDREERPDIDSIYMTFCQAYTGSGGWPLTIIMTPDKKPFFAGTYFPKRGRSGYYGLMDILDSAFSQWIENRENIISSSVKLIEHVKNFQVYKGKDELDKNVIDEALRELKGSFDRKYGGFGLAPKFPVPSNIYFLLRIYNQNKDKEILSIVEQTLKGMYKGGIFDHIGFGFSRYSTDSKWLVPHFEKMLYDNALIALAYIETYLVTKDKFYKEVAEKIFTYVLRDMQQEQGGFYCAEDADSEGEEGKFYVFDFNEIKSILGEEKAKVFCDIYNITPNGNFEGKNILNLLNSDLNMDKDLAEKIEDMRKVLFNYREKRVHPHKDDKFLTSWNGLMIAALAYAGRAFTNDSYVEAAEKAVEFITKNMINNEGRLMSRYRKRSVDFKGYLEDYSYLVWGLIELYETTFKVEYLKLALKLTEDMIKLFWDKEKGGFYLYGYDSEELILRPKELYDGALPSGNSCSALNLLRLSRITGNTEFLDIANKMFDFFASSVKSSPNAYVHFLNSFMYTISSSKDIVICGNKKSARDMIDVINREFNPFVTVVLNDGNAELYKLIPFLHNGYNLKDTVEGYICKDFSCTPPINDIEKFSHELYSQS